MSAPCASGARAGARRPGRWLSGWRMPPRPAARRGSRRNRSARSSHWLAWSRTMRTGRSATGARGNWPTRSCGGALWTTSRPGTRGGCFHDSDLKPHQIRSWLTPPDDEPQREEKIFEVCEVYRAAPARAAQGERTVSTDEMTGVQALERAAPGLPLVPGKVERREFAYIRHGTRCFTINFD